MIDILSLTKDELRGILEERGFKKYRYKQIFSFLHKHLIDDFDEITVIKKSVREELKGIFCIKDSKNVQEELSNDNAVKYLFEFDDSVSIESVLIPMKDDKSRFTICVSTQAGCKMGCLFCATGKMGFKRNLTASEIIFQIRYIVKKHHLENINVVYMGMGEPLDNYENVIKSIKILSDEDGLNISKRKITLSTCGIVPSIERLKQDLPNINIALSLHSAINKKRDLLMPINKTYPLDAVMRSLKGFPLPHRKRITFEYVMIKGVNDTEEDKKALLKLLSTYKSKLNIIPLNKHQLMDVDIEPSSSEKIEEFSRYLREKGVFVTVRKSKGSSINAACGMLATCGRSAFKTS